jgi:hypothetical protein
LEVYMRAKLIRRIKKFYKKVKKRFFGKLCKCDD